MKKRLKVLKRLLAVMLCLMLTTGMLPPSVLVAQAQTSKTASTATLQSASATTLKNPRIVEDSSMKAGQKVTWDCVWFGSYPQSEVTSSDSTYSKLASATGWNSNNDIILNGVKYRRMKQSDATYTSGSSEYYNWSDSTTYHYFKYEPIKWRVLEVSGGQALLMADIVLDDQRYNKNYTSVTWETSSIRSWLNGYGASNNQPQIDYTNKNFMNSAFSSNEKTAILTTNVENKNNLSYNTNGGNNTSDKVFLLSESEVYSDSAKSHGFVSDRTTYDEARRCKSSTYAKAMGTWSYTDTTYKGNCYWWLRSPGSYTFDAAYVSSSGYGDSYGIYVSLYNDGVRPALNLNLSSSHLYTYAGTVSSDGATNEEESPNNKYDINNGEKFSPSLNGNLSIHVYGRTKTSINKVSDLTQNKITDFTVSPNNGSVEDGVYEVKLSEAEKSNYTIMADSYQKYIIPKQVIKSVKNESLGANLSISTNLNLDKKDGKPYISTVYGKVNTDEYSYKEITKNNLNIEEGKEYSIIVSACDVGEDVKYYLYQKGGKKIENTTGVFTKEMYSQFSDEGTIYAYVKGSNGTSPAVALKMKKILSNRDSQMQNLLDSGEIGLTGNISELVTSGTDFLDKATIDLSVFKVPIDFTIEDNTLKMSIGLKLWNKGKSTKGNSTTGTKYKNDYAYSNFVSDFKDLWSNPSKDLTKNYTKAKAIQEKYDKTTSTVKSRSKNWNFSALGYAQWEYIDGKWVFKEGKASLAGSYQFKYSQQGFVWVVPEYTYFSAKLELAGNGKWDKAGPADSDDYPIQLKLSVSTTPQLRVGGGVGFQDLASAGFWGSLSLPTTFNFTDKHLTMDAKGELGYETKFLYIFGTGKTLFKGEKHLIDKYWNNKKTKSLMHAAKRQVASDTETVKSEEIPITIEDRSYAKNTSDWLDNGTKRKALQRSAARSNNSVDAGMTFKTLQTSIFEGATPQVVSVGDTMIMTFIQDDASRDTYNRMRLVYSIYDKTSKTWSAPQPVLDDGMNDVNPVIVSDGTNAFVSWQKICKKLSEETTTTKDVCENTEIYTAKYNKETNKFENATRVTNNTCYDYAQSIGISNGNPVIYYASCTDNNMNGTKNTDILKFVNGSATKILSAKNYIYSMDANRTGSKCTFIMDEDGDTSNNDDVKAYTWSNDSVSESKLDSAVMATAYIGSAEKLLLTDGNNIYEKNNGEWTPIFENVTSIVGGIKSTVVDGETILSWTQANEDGTTDLYYASNSDGKWSEAVKLTSQDKLISSVSVASCDNKLYGIVTKTTINTDSEGNQTKGQTDLESFAFNDYADIGVDFLSANEGNFYAGEDSKFDVTLTNNGTLDVDSVKFTIKDTLGNSQTETKSVSLKPGASTNVTLTYSVPNDYAKTTLTVEAEPVGLNDIVPENNSTTKEIGLPDLYFENTNVIACEDGYLVEAYLYNASDVAAKNVDVTLNYNSTETEAVKVYSTQSLSSNESIFVQAEVLTKNLEFDEDEIAKVYFTASSDGKDSYEEDNTELISLKDKVTSSDTLHDDIDHDGLCDICDDHEDIGNVTVSYDKDVTVMQDDTLTLSANVTPKAEYADKEITYQWYEADTDGNYTKIKDATTAEYVQENCSLDIGTHTYRLQALCDGIIRYIPFTVTVKESLSSLIKKAENIVSDKENKYSKATLERLNTALAMAKSLSDSSTQEDRWNAYNELEVALNTMEKAHTIVKISSNPKNSGILDGGGKYETGDEIILKAQAVDGFVFVGWYDKEQITDSDQPLSTDTTYKYGVVGEQTPSEISLYAVYKSNENRQLSMTLGNGNVEYSYQNGTKTGTWNNDFINNEFARGTYFTVTAKPNDGYTFLYWINSDGRVLSDSPTYSFYLGDNMKLQVCYKRMESSETEIKKHYIIFKDMSGKILWSGDVSMDKGEDGEKYGTVKVPEHGIFTGYTFKQWKDASGNVITVEDGKIKITESVTIYAEYEAVSGLTLTVDGVQRGETYSYGSLVKVTADESKDGKYFSGWYIGDKLVSDKREYSFYITDNTVITAKYEGTEVITQKPLVNMTMSERTTLTGGKQNVVMNVTWSVPDGYEYIEAGLVRTLEDGYKEQLELDKVDNTNVKKDSSRLTTAEGTMANTLTLGPVSAKKNLYARGYLTYRDVVSGKVITVYTDTFTSSAGN